MESVGGHTLERHVSKTNEELVRRAIQESVEAATSYTSKSVAIKAVQENLRKNAEDIAKWLLEDGAAKQTFDIVYNKVIGKGVLSDKKSITYNLKKSRMVLVKDSSQKLGFKIITSFPVIK